MTLIKTFFCKPLNLNKSRVTNMKFLSEVAKQKNYKVVKLSYASYENTQSHTAEGAHPLIVMHGLFGSKGNWNSLCKVLHQKSQPQRKVIAIDARNHGDSPHSSEHSYAHLAEDLKALLSSLNIEKVCLLGHSMGGRAMMYFALKYPELVSRLLVADISPITTSPNLRVMPSILEALQKVKLPTKIPLSSARVGVDMQLSRNINDKGLRTFLLTNLVQNSNGNYHWRINIAALMDNFSNNIAIFPKVDGLKFEQPVLFIGGGASDFIQKSDHPLIKKIFPKAEFRYIEGAGHWLHTEKPVEFLQLCLDFLNRNVKETEQSSQN